MSKKNFIISTIIGVLLLVLGIVLCNINFKNSYDQNLSIELKNDNKLMKLAYVESDGGYYQITATVLPAEAVDKTLNWKLKWADSFTGAISNYVNMEVAEDTLSAKVKQLKQFDHEIILTVSSVSNSSVSSTCRIGCYKRVDKVTVSAYSDTDSGAGPLTVSDTQKTISFKAHKGCSFTNLKLTGVGFIYFLSGTKDLDNLAEFGYIQLSDELKTTLDSLYVDYENKSLDVSSYDLENKGSIYNLLCYFITDLDTAGIDVFSELVVSLKNITCWFEYNISFQTSPDLSFDSYTYKIIDIDVSYYENVVSVALDESSIIF